MLPNFKFGLLGQFLLRRLFAAHCHKVKSALFEVKSVTAAASSREKTPWFFNVRMGSFGNITIRPFSAYMELLCMDYGIKEHLPKAITLCVSLQESTAGALQGLDPSLRVIGAILALPGDLATSGYGSAPPTHRGHKSFLCGEIEIELLPGGTEGA